MLHAKYFSELIDDEEIFILCLENKDSQVDVDSLVFAIGAGQSMGPLSKRHFCKLLDFTHEHQQFRIGLRIVGVRRIPLEITLFSINNGWVRVNISQIECSCCGWKGFSADPSDPGLYYGTPSYPKPYEASLELPVVDFPRCTSSLYGRPIWVCQR